MPRMGGHTQFWIVRHEGPGIVWALQAPHKEGRSEVAGRSFRR